MVCVQSLRISRSFSEMALLLLGHKLGDLTFSLPCMTVHIDKLLSSLTRVSYRGGGGSGGNPTPLGNSPPLYYRQIFDNN